MLDSKKIFEALSEIDDEFISRSEVKEKSIVNKSIIFVSKLAAACVIIMLLSTGIYEAGKKISDDNRPVEDNQTQNGQAQNGTVDVVPVDRINVSAFSEDSKYYDAAATVGYIEYNQKQYKIVAGVDVKSEEVGEVIETYLVENEKQYTSAGDKVSITLYKKNGYYEWDGMALSIEGIDGYFFVYNVGNLIVSNE